MPTRKIRRRECRGLRRYAVGTSTLRLASTPTEIYYRTDYISLSSSALMWGGARNKYIWKPRALHDDASRNFARQLPWERLDGPRRASVRWPGSFRLMARRISQFSRWEADWLIRIKLREAWSECQSSLWYSKLKYYMLIVTSLYRNNVSLIHQCLWLFVTELIFIEFVNDFWRSHRQVSLNYHPVSL